MSARARYDRDVRRARQAPASAGGLALIALAAVSWGTSGSVMTVLAARAAASPLLVGVARLWVAAILLLLAAAASRQSLAAATAGDRWRWLAMGACMAGYQAAYFTAVTLSGITTTALVAICSAPLLIAALAPWLLGERLTTRGRLALGLGVTGTALLVSAPATVSDGSARFLAGALLALIAGLAYALFVLTAKAGLARTAPLPLTALTFAAGVGRGDRDTARALDRDDPRRGALRREARRSRRRRRRAARWRARPAAQRRPGALSARVTAPGSAA